ncbi:DUF5990 family protein [Streptomyces sp. R33]|uniref:DUF5990 family protein n=1 Tax=Streptomyces sp. R33 TaxID=3238629 RepID=A0AB39Y9A6_9ACTN
MWRARRLAHGPDVVRWSDDGRLLARLRLTDACGRPLCAQVRPPLVEWSAAPVA